MVCFHLQLELDEIAIVAGDHAASECAYAIRQGRLSNRGFNQIIDSLFKDGVEEFRDAFTSGKLRNEGNVAMAKVEINGIKSEWFAHSKISSIDQVVPPGAVSNISLMPDYPIFSAVKVGSHYRNVDTEYKILSDIANAIGDNYSISGKISLFTELPPCDSCSYVIAQFVNKYKSIVIEVIDSGGNKFLP